MQEKYFNGDDVIDDVTGWPQSRFSIFFYEWKTNIFRDNCRTNKDIIFKLSVHMYHWIVNLPLQTIVDCFGDDVIGSPNKSKLWTVIALSIFELEHGSKIQMSQIRMAIFVAYSNSGVTSGWISSRPQDGGHFENVKILNTASIWHPKWKEHPKRCTEKHFMLIKSSMTSQGDLKVASLYSIINEK